MADAGKDAVDRVLGELLRSPEPIRDLELERALVRLQAARGDAAYLLLHRVMVLEVALMQLRQRAVEASGPADAASAMPMTPASPAPGSAISGMPAAVRTAVAQRSFLRDAAVVTLGVVAGQALAAHLLPGGAELGTDPGGEVPDADLLGGLDF